MMAQQISHLPPEKRRVKVYDLRNNDWFDHGTGFCSVVVVESKDGQDRDPRVRVESEELPRRVLLETRIFKEDGFRRQGDTLIVWTEPSDGLNMALSFQESEGCAFIWKYVSGVQRSFQVARENAVEDRLADDLAIEMPGTLTLLPAELGHINDIDSTMRIMSVSSAGRDSLARFIVAEDYLSKVAPMVEMAEDLESLPDLHSLCSIMKTIILLNDTTIIEQAVSDECVLGVVGALEYDPDFPNLKANHRVWLDNQERYKEVVPILDEQIRKKIHQTYRLQYLKDVVLARILDDPTFSVLNSLIFFNQVDIVQYLKDNLDFLGELFGIFDVPSQDQERRKQAVVFIQHCCAIAKNLQPPSRQALYENLMAHGLLNVIFYGLRHRDVAVRVGATDILVSMIEHDVQSIREIIYRQLQENQSPITDSLVDLLLIEVDLGVKSQISDALRVLLDVSPITALPEDDIAKADDELAGRLRQQVIVDYQQELFLQRFYESSAPRLFKVLVDLEGQTDMNFSVQMTSVFGHLLEILCFLIRQHETRCKFFVMQYNIASGVAQLLRCRDKFLQLGKWLWLVRSSHSLPLPRSASGPRCISPSSASICHRKRWTAEKKNSSEHGLDWSNILLGWFSYLVLTTSTIAVAIRFFRQLVGLQDEFYIRHITEKQILGSVLDVLVVAMPRESLLSSAALDLFDYITRENIIECMKDLVQNHRDKLTCLSYVESFRAMILRYDKTCGYTIELFAETEDEAMRALQPSRLGQPPMVDAAEEEWYNTSDDEDDQSNARSGLDSSPDRISRPAPIRKPLVDYLSDEEGDENADPEPAVGSELRASGEPNVDNRPHRVVVPPLERISEKRRREEEEDDALESLMQEKRRRNSMSAGSVDGLTGPVMARQRRASTGTTARRASNTPRRISIKLSPGPKSDSESRSKEQI